MNATGVLLEVARLFPGQDLAALTRAAERVPAGCDGLLFVPYLQGERVPDLPEATGALLGLRPGALEPGRLFRAALEGVSLNLAWGADRMRELGLAIDELRLVGGGARNALWARILCDALGARLVELVESESAALGAALQAAWIARGGSLDALAQDFARASAAPLVPEAAASRVYRAAGERFRERVARLFP
jgi:sugar (pentulose or hexulose) kinase